MRMEHQEMSAAMRNDSVTTVQIQREAGQLLNICREAPGPKQKEPGVLEFSNIFANLPEKPGQCSLNTRCDQAKRFKSDPEYKSPRSGEWQKDMQKQRQKDLDVDGDSNYKVKRGDTVWTIAERLCRGADGKRPNDQIIDKMKRRLIEANPQLKCNPDFLKEGEKLKIPQDGSNKQKPDVPFLKPSRVQELPLPPKDNLPPKSELPPKCDLTPSLPKQSGSGRAPDREIKDGRANPTESTQRKDTKNEIPIIVEEKEVPRRVERTIGLPNGERVGIQTGAAEEDKVILRDKDGNVIKEKTTNILLSNPPIYVTEFENGAIARTRLDETTVTYPDGTEVTIKNGQFKRITRGR